MEREKQKARNQAKAEAARKLAAAQGGIYWIGTEATLLPKRHANLVFLHARRQPFPSFPELAEALQVVWPWGEAATITESSSVWESAGRKPRKKRQSGKGVLMLRPAGICSLI